MEITEALVRIQSAYPRIYLACHSRHQNGRTTEIRISQRDATLLAHLSERNPVSHADLAWHLGIAKSTLSEALAGLESRDYVSKRQDADDGRGILILRTRAGTEAMSRGSVLESSGLIAILERIAPADRARAVEGLEILAAATGQPKVEGASA